MVRGVHSTMYVCTTRSRTPHGQRCTVPAPSTLPPEPVQDQGPVSPYQAPIVRQESGVQRRVGDDVARVVGGYVLAGARSVNVATGAQHTTP